VRVLKKRSQQKLKARFSKRGLQESLHPPSLQPPYQFQLPFLIVTSVTSAQAYVRNCGWGTCVGKGRVGWDPLGGLGLGGVGWAGVAWGEAGWGGIRWVGGLGWGAGPSSLRLHNPLPQGAKM
jgi:hypothetical protein